MVSVQLSDAAVLFSLVTSCILKTPAALTVVFLLKYSVVAETLWWAAFFPLLSLDPKLNRPDLFFVCLTCVPFLQMWRFTLERSVMRKEITSIIKVRSTRWLVVGFRSRSALDSNSRFNDPDRNRHIWSRDEKEGENKKTNKPKKPKKTTRNERRRRRAGLKDIVKEIQDLFESWVLHIQGRNQTRNGRRRSQGF